MENEITQEEMNIINQVAKFRSMVTSLTIQLKHKGIPEEEAKEQAFKTVQQMFKENNL